MNKRFNMYLLNANNAYQKGFTSIAAKKRAIEYVRRAYDVLGGTFDKYGIMDILLRAKQYGHEFDNHEAMYWGVPDLHHWKAKHDAMFTEFFPDHVAHIHDLIVLRIAIKEAPIVATPKSEVAKRVQIIQRSIRDELDYRKEKFNSGMDLAKIVGPNVTANVHLVHGEKGTLFLRAFYYLNGVFTPLNTIIAIMEIMEREEKRGKMK